VVGDGVESMTVMPIFLSSVSAIALIGVIVEEASG
jgi:hypothetical protein